MLTEQQSAILAFVREFSAQHGYPPTVREIGAAIGSQSPATTQRYLGKLERAGRIHRTPGISRGLRIVEPVAVAA